MRRLFAAKSLSREEPTFLSFSSSSATRFHKALLLRSRLPKLGDANIKGSLIVGSLEQIFKREGMRGLYRGLSPTVMALLSNWLKSFLCSNDHKLSVGANVLAASGAGAAST